MTTEVTDPTSLTPVWGEDGRADEESRQTAYDYIILAAGLPEQSIDLEKLAVALEVIEADVDWLTELGSTPEGLQRLFAVGPVIIGLNMLQANLAVAADPKLGMVRQLPEVVEDITKRIDGILPQMADIYNAEEVVAEFLESGGDPQEVLNALAVLRIMKPDDDDLRANVPTGAGDYFDLLPDVAARFSVTPDDLDRIVYGITGGGAAELAEAAGFGYFTGVGGPPPAPSEGPPPFIGVPEGFTVPRQPSGRAFQSDIGGRPVGSPSLSPRYRFGDHQDPSRLGQVEIRRRQKQLEAAGLLEPGGYIPGFWDKASEDALWQAMYYANIQGDEVENIISELQQLRPADRDNIEKFVPPPEITPDPAAIAQRVKRAFRSQLGRDPTDEEMGDFAAYLTNQYGVAYDEQVAMAQAAFDAENTLPREPSGRAFQSDIGGRPIADVPTGRSSFTDVDPAARFQQMFDKRFGPEMDFIEGQEDTHEIQRRLFENSERITALMTGRR